MIRTKIWSPVDGDKYGILPTPHKTSGNNFDVYFGSIPSGCSGASIFKNKYALNGQLIGYKEEPEHILAPGNEGTFDCHGVNPSSVVEYNGDLYLYYVGYQRTEGKPYMLWPGLAIISQSDNSLFRMSVPIIDRNALFPYSAGAPFVMKDGNVWKMWYWLATEWTSVAGKDYLANNIAYAESHDGMVWRTVKTDCLVPEGNEFSLGRPWVLKSAGKYLMYYCSRTRFGSGAYNILSAVSDDGISWRKIGLEIIKPGNSGWDSEMVAYPAVIEIGNKLLMLYNGNRNGLNGYGGCEI